MSPIQESALYDELVDVLAESVDSERLLSFRLSDEKQTRLEELLEKNRHGTLTPQENSELDAFEHFEHLIRLLKARLVQKPSA